MAGIGKVISLYISYGIQRFRKNVTNTISVIANIYEHNQTMAKSPTQNSLSKKFLCICCLLITYFYSNQTNKQKNIKQPRTTFWKLHRHSVSLTSSINWTRNRIYLLEWKKYLIWIWLKKNIPLQCHFYTKMIHIIFRCFGRKVG